LDDIRASFFKIFHFYMVLHQNWQLQFTTYNVNHFTLRPTNSWCHEWSRSRIV
jgi:hypothetical protein